MSDTQSFEDRAGYAFQGQPQQPSDQQAGVPEALETAGEAPPSMVDKPAPGGGSINDRVMQALERAQQQGEGIMAGSRANTAKAVEEIDKSRKDIESVPVPQFGKQPEAPKANLGQGLMEYTQFATVLAAIAGGLARNNATVALTAFAGAIKGFTEGKKEDFSAKAEEWKLASEQLKADNQAKLDQYDLTLKSKKMSADMKMAALKLTAVQYNDEMTYNLGVQGRLEQIAMLNMREKQMQANLEKSDLQTRAMLTNIELKLADHQALEDGAQAIADGVKDGTFPPDQLGKYKTNQLVMGKLRGTNVSKLQLEWAAAKKQIQSLYGPQLTRFKATANSVVNTIDEVKALAAELKQSGIPLKNKAELTALMQLKGNSEEGQLATRYITAVNTLKEEFATLAQGGYAPTESVWALANQQIDQNYGVDQMTSSLSEIQRLVRYRINAFEEMDPLKRKIGPGATDTAPAAPGGGGNDVDDAMKRLGL